MLHIPATSICKADRKPFNMKPWILSESYLNAMWSISFNCETLGKVRDPTLGKPVGKDSNMALSHLYVHA